MDLYRGSLDARKGRLLERAGGTNGGGGRTPEKNLKGVRS